MKKKESVWWSHSICLGAAIVLSLPLYVAWIFVPNAFPILVAWLIVRPIYKIWKEFE